MKIIILFLLFSFSIDAQQSGNLATDTWVVGSLPRDNSLSMCRFFVEIKRPQLVGLLYKNGTP